MKRINKYLYGWRIMVQYTSVWEYECFELTWKEAREQLRAYRNNTPFPVKAVYGRELNPEYTEGAAR